MNRPSRTGPVNYRLLLLTLVSVAVLLTAGLAWVQIDFDVLNSLPDTNTVVADAKYIFTHHPFQDQVVIDVTATHVDLNQLATKAALIEAELEASGLFAQVGFKDKELLVPGLLTYIVDNLPYLFSAEELESKIQPLLSPENVNRQLTLLLQQLSGIEGVGQSELMAADPLGLRNLVLGRLAGMNPVQGTGFYRGFPVSSDKRHLLIVATPQGSGTDTATSVKIKQLLDRLTRTINQPPPGNDSAFSMNAVGSFRAALDNETIVRRDTRAAIAFATIGIILLLLISFPRPYLGLLSLVPAAVGTIMAFFICALLQSSISILAIGFGGAIISITVDHSIAYLLFLDRPEKVYVKQAAEEVRAIGLIAVLTTVGAFLVLNISGFSILAQIGRFAALGIACSFIFVHTIFPRLIPVIPPAKRKHAPWLLKMVRRFSRFRHPVLPVSVLLFACVMAFFAKPRFNVDLRHMNTVSPETLAAETSLSQTWGNISSKIHLLLEAESLDELRQQSDRLTRKLEKEVARQSLDQAFTPTALLPGRQTATSNFRDWQAFWSLGRGAALKHQVDQRSEVLGFNRNAFQTFFDKLAPSNPEQLEMPPELLAVLNIRHDVLSGNWLLFVTLTPDTRFNSLEFKDLLSTLPGIRLFDPGLFSAELGQLLSDTFLNMLLLIGVSVICLIFLFFLDWKLTLLAVVPLLFSLICTIGTLNFLNHPLNIPGLMLTIIVVGMGIDYSLFMIRSYQRYGNESHPFHGLVRMAILLAAGSTMVGFGVLVSADHYLLHSAGLISLLGIGYALIGTFTLMPPLLRWRFIDQPIVIKGKNRFQRTNSRYRSVEAFPRMFARFKLLMDPMFAEIDRFLENPGKVIDIGCGYGVPAAWILDRYPYTRFFGLDPNAERVRVANKMLGSSGIVKQGQAPALPETNGPVDTAMMLDMLHYLSDPELNEVFLNLRSALIKNGKLIIRVTLPLITPAPWYRRVEALQIRLRKRQAFYRPLGEILYALQTCGFQDIFHYPSGSNREEIWITARAGRKARSAENRH